MCLFYGYGLFLIRFSFVFVACAVAAETPEWYYREGPLRGSLKSGDPLPLYDADPRHLWHRLFAVFCIRPSELPSRPEYPRSQRIARWKQRQEDYLRLVEYARADDQGDR